LDPHYKNWEWRCACGFAHISRGYDVHDINEVMEETIKPKCPQCGKMLERPTEAAA